jgi:hypothetical protein
LPFWALPKNLFRLRFKVKPIFPLVSVYAESPCEFARGKGKIGRFFRVGVIFSMVPTPAVNTRSNRHPYAIPVSTPYPPSVRWNNRKPQLQSAKNTYSQSNEYVALSKRPVSCPPRELPPRPARRPQTGRQAIQPASALWRVVFPVVPDADPTTRDRFRIQGSRGTPIRLGITPFAQPGAPIKKRV